MLPETEVNNPKDLEDSIRLAEQLKIKHYVIEIDEALKTISRKFPWDSYPAICERKSNANIKPRIRMIYEYLAANLDSRLVLGTSNKTELLLGYFTKHGDGACDLEPIGGLYKTQVKQLAGHLKIPDSIINKIPTAGLWKGQTDESEIGMKYSDIDAILYNLVDCDNSIAKTARNTGLSMSKVEKIAGKIMESEHKRKMPAVVEI
jgi:NAD+ synthase